MPEMHLRLIKLEYYLLKAKKQYKNLKKEEIQHIPIKTN